MRLLRVVSPMIVFGLLALAAGEAHAAPDVALELTDTDPVAPATLARGEQFFVRVAYRSDRALRLRIGGFRGTAQLPAITSPSPRYPAGSAETIVWIAFDAPVHADAIVVTAEDEATRQALTSVSLPVDLQWTSAAPRDARATPAWASELSAAQQRAVSAQARTAQQRSSGSDTLFALLISLSIPAYLVVQIWTLRRLHDGWRKAALLPAFLMGGALGVSLIALASQSNLWPIWLILLSPVALLYLLVLLALRHLHGSTTTADI